MKSITKQLKRELSRFEIQKKEIETIFIGGGTPSSIKAHLYEELFEIVDPYLANNIEITTEANPNSASLSWIKDMKKLGINRISFGVQSFNDDKLRYLGRNHSGKLAKKAILNAYDAGIENISLDLIHSTRYDTPELLKKDLKIAFSLPINHISTYALSIEKGTKFYIDKEIPKDDIKEQKEFYEEIKKRDFIQYEISNFGKYICRHNLGYWKHKEYIGIGAGAIGFRKYQRLYTHKSIQNYIKNPTYTKIEKLSDEDIKMEKVFLGLRSIVGVDINIFNKDENEKIKILLKEKKIRFENEKIYNTDYLLSDEIALFILS